jgi:Tfp pilus assembly protein PilF
MGRSLALTSEAAPVESYDLAAGNPFEKEGFQFLIERRDGHVFHRDLRRDANGDTVAVFAAKVQFAVGSGRRGRTYLINRDGYLFQSPISWYSQPRTWDLTPGFQVREQFERPVEPSCLFCHCNQVEPVPNTINRYRPPIFRGQAIGCERCHGPGDLHVKTQERGEDARNTIVNPGRLEPALRDAVCQQCHLQGESRVVRRGRQLFDFRPGLPLHLFLSVFVRRDEFADGQSSGSHTEQIYRSRCFRESRGRLGCISCHDPHALPDAGQRVAYYRRRCLACHTEQSCGMPASVRLAKIPTDDCVRCHMPPTGSKIVHRAVTDHRIRRRLELDHPLEDTSRLLRPGETPLVHFHRDQVSRPDEEISRDLGLALTELGRTYPQLVSRVNPIALPLLETAVQAAPEDVLAWEAKGFALWQLDRRAEALTAFRAALALAPQRELTLTYLGVLAAILERREEAVSYWQRALAVNPWCSQYHYRLASLLAESQQWQKALDEDEKAIELNPAADEMRLLRIACLFKAGEAEEARSAFEKLVALRPQDREKLLRWFAEHVRESAP